MRLFTASALRGGTNENNFRDMRFYSGSALCSGGENNNDVPGTRQNVHPRFLDCLCLTDLPPHLLLGDTTLLTYTNN